jgi:TP901 family phage tail tape measure protein
MSTPNVAASVAVRIGAVMDATLGAAFGKTTTGLKQIGATMRDLAGRAQELKHLEAATVQLGDTVNSLTARYDKQAATLARAEAAFAKVKDKVTSAGAADEKLTAQLARADAAVVRARGNLERTGASLAKAKADLLETTAAAEKFRAVNEHVETLLGRLGAAMQRYEAASSRVQANAARRAEYRSKLLGVLATGYFIRNSVEKAAESEGAALRFRWSLDGTYNNRQIGALIAATRQSAARSLATPAELLNIQTVLHKEDLSAEEARLAAETVHRVASVTRQDAEATARAIGGIFHVVSLGMSGSTEQKLTHLGDLVATLEQRFAISDVGALSQGLTKALPQAQMARVSFEQTAAAIGALTRNGMDAGAAGQQMSALLRNLTKASQELGFHLVRDSSGALDFEATLRAMNARLNQMGGLTRARDALTQAFTRRGADAAYFLSQAAATGELARAQQEMAGSAGSVAREYRQLSDSAQGMLVKISKAWNQTLLPIGRALLPGVKAILVPLGELSVRLGTFLEQHKTLAKWLGATATVLLGLTALVYAGGYAWTTLAGAYAKVGEILAWVNLKLVAHRIGLLGNAGAAVAAETAEGGLATAETAEATAAETANAATVTRIGLLGQLKLALLGVGNVLAASPLLGGLLVGGLGAVTGGLIAYHQQQEFQAATDERFRRWSGTHLVLNHGTAAPGTVQEGAQVPGGHALPKLPQVPIETPLTGRIEIGSPKKMAQGGIATRPALVEVGDAGPEGIVPLSRNPNALGSTTYHFHMPITIHEASDAQAVATRVRTELERAVREAEARRRGGLHD